MIDIEKAIYKYFYRNFAFDDQDSISEESLNDFFETTIEMAQNPRLIRHIDKFAQCHHFTAEEKQKMLLHIKHKYQFKMKREYIVVSNEQRARDTIWWDRKKKKLPDDSYWNCYYESLRLGPIPKLRLDQSTDQLLNNLFDPLTPNCDKRYGMVVGHVQSGKTSNYIGAVTKAADAGYKFFVIITGIHNNLRNQTQDRFDEFVERYKNIHGEKGEPNVLTHKLMDFDKECVQRFGSVNIENSDVPILTIIKKNSHTLKNVIDWLNKRYSQKINSSVFIIDDEADNASINTNSRDDDPTTINKYIRQIIDKFTKSAYVAYTATPFANIFIDDQAQDDLVGRDLFPDDFILALEPSPEYWGAQRIFLPTEAEDDIIQTIDDWDDYVQKKGKKGLEMDNLPPSLKEAIRCFYINIAIRNLRGARNEHNSMLVHATRLTLGHELIESLIVDYVDWLNKDIGNNGLLRDCNKYPAYNLISDTYVKLYSRCEFSFSDLWNEICNFYDEIDVYGVYHGSRKTLDYNKPNAPKLKAIAVGGNSLSRGFTLEGLNVTYFTRAACTADTLMQMGRWFGYRNHYGDICKLYMTDQIIYNFKNVTESTLDLMDSLNDMHECNKTPKEFGLAVRTHPGSVLITARNKCRATEKFTRNFSLDGLTKETNWVVSNDEDLNSNLILTDEFVKSLDYNECIREHDNKYLWENIPSDRIQQYLRSYKLPNKEYDHFPMEIIQEFLNKHPEVKWNVLVYGTAKSGEMSYRISESISIGVQERKATFNENYQAIELGSNRQVSSANAESYGIRKELLDKLTAEFGKKLNRCDIKKRMHNPIMILHYIRNFDHKDSQIYSAISLCFPRNDIFAGKTVQYIYNTVKIRNMLGEDGENDSSTNDDAMGDAS